jgi:hypothetical protein
MTCCAILEIAEPSQGARQRDEGRFPFIRIGLYTYSYSRPSRVPSPFPPSRRPRLTSPSSREPRRAAKTFTMPPVGDGRAVKIVTHIYYSIYRPEKKPHKTFQTAPVPEQNCSKPHRNGLTHLTKRPLVVHKPAFSTPPGPVGQPRPTQNPSGLGSRYTIVYNFRRLAAAQDPGDLTVAARKDEGQRHDDHGPPEAGRLRQASRATGRCRSIRIPQFAIRNRRGSGA